MELEQWQAMAGTFGLTALIVVFVGYVVLPWWTKGPDIQDDVKTWFDEEGRQ